MDPVHKLHNGAYDQFRHARRRATVERILAWLRRRSADLLCYGQVRDRLSPQAKRDLGVREIP